MHREGFGENDFVHVFSRGVEKRLIFLDDHDRWRFLALLILLQGDVVLPQIGRLVKDVKHLVFDKEPFLKIADKKYIELVSFCLMPNHFHLILHEISEGGISRYMQRLLNAYAKYFNTRHKRSGHLFSGPFRAIRVDNDEYLDYLSAYIHLNPKELNGWRNREVEYFWSSFQDLVDGNRWAQFLYTDIITDKFKNGKEYYDFVIETPIKEIKNELEEELLIDD
mgnify:CR=1 FL=1